MTKARAVKKSKLNRLSQSSHEHFETFRELILTENQKKFVSSIEENVLTICTGPAGTGKTLLACLYAARMLNSNTIDRVCITRSMVCMDKNIGYLPGTEREKMEPFVGPMLEYFERIFGRVNTTKMKDTNQIRVVPLPLIRGASWDNTIIILDEAQNTTPHEFKTLLTRLGQNSKIIVLADLDQSDIKEKGFVSGVEDFVIRMKAFVGDTKSEFISITELAEEDIKRSDFVRHVVQIYKS